MAFKQLPNRIYTSKFFPKAPRCPFKTFKQIAYAYRKAPTRNSRWILNPSTPCTVQQTTTPNTLSEFPKRQRQSGNKNLSVDKSHCTKKRSFLLRISSVNVTKPTVSYGLITFTEEILNGKLHILSSEQCVKGCFHLVVLPRAYNRMCPWHCVTHNDDSRKYKNRCWFPTKSVWLEFISNITVYHNRLTIDKEF